MTVSRNTGKTPYQWKSPIRASLSAVFEGIQKNNILSLTICGSGLKVTILRLTRRGRGTVVEE